MEKAPVPFVLNLIVRHLVLLRLRQLNSVILLPKVEESHLKWFDQPVDVRLAIFVQISFFFDELLVNEDIPLGLLLILIRVFGIDQRFVVIEQLLEALGLLVLSLNSIANRHEFVLKVVHWDFHWGFWRFSSFHHVPVKKVVFMQILIIVFS